MVVVTANWGIGDGSLCASPSRSTVARFVADVQRAAILAGWREPDRYEPVDGADVVFAGDTFDTILSREWLGRCRPWQRGAGARATRERIAASSRSAFRRILAPLLHAAAEGIDLPRAGSNGRPAVGPPVRVPLRVTILSGNLDADICDVLAGDREGIRGLHVGSVWEDGWTRIEHGHDADWFWQGGPGTPSVGASLRIDLLGRFLLSPSVAALGDAARRRLAQRLASTDRGVGWDPTSVTPDPGERSALEKDWRAAVATWRRAARAAGLEGDVSCDLVDAIAASLLGGDPRPTRSAPVWGDLRAALAAQVPPPRSRSGSAERTVVLGHPGSRDSRPWETPRVVCLGHDVVAGEGVSPGVREVGAAGPEALGLFVVPSAGSPAPCPGQTSLSEWSARRSDAAPRADDGGRFRIVEAA